MPIVPISSIDDPRLDGSRFPMKSLLLSPAALDDFSDVVHRAGTLPVFVVDQAVMSAVAGFNFHRGCLAVGVRPQASLWSAVAHDAKVAVGLEQISNVDNGPAKAGHYVLSVFVRTVGIRT